VQLGFIAAHRPRTQRAVPSSIAGLCGEGELTISPEFHRGSNAVPQGGCLVVSCLGAAPIATVAACPITNALPRQAGFAKRVRSHRNCRCSH